VCFARASPADRALPIRALPIRALPIPRRASPRWPPPCPCSLPVSLSLLPLEDRREWHSTAVAGCV